MLLSQNSIDYMCYMPNYIQSFPFFSHKVKIKNKIATSLKKIRTNRVIDTDNLLM